MSTKPSRIQSIDLLRGIIIIIMALDHTRSFWGQTPFDPTDLTQTDASWFFTRWITHFCAPLFVFLSGISAFLYQQKVGSKRQLRNFLLSRGIWIIFLELTLINFSWQFAFFAIFIQVMWVIGVSMVILAFLIYLPRQWIFAISLSVVVLHNAINDVWLSEVLGRNIALILHTQGWIPIGSKGFGVFVMYPLIPWFAVMGLGYVLGQLFLQPSYLRQKYLVVIGVSCISLFLILRMFVGYGDPKMWELDSEVSLLAIFNTTKYPPSLQFLLMTIGPGLLCLMLLEKAQVSIERLKLYQWTLAIGKVPMFFYILHVPLINFGAQIFTWIQFEKAINFNMVSPSNWPEAYSPSLLVVYLAWLAVVFILYFPCKNYSEYKQNNRSPWLSYI